MLAGWDAAPADWLRKPIPGRLGPRPTDTTIRAQGALLDGRGAVRSGSQARPEALMRTPRWSVGRRRAPEFGAPRRLVPGGVIHRRTRRDRDVASTGAPSPRVFRGRNDTAPGRPTNPGDRARPQHKEHDPEKWIPVFGQDHAQTRMIMGRATTPQRSKPAVLQASMRLRSARQGHGRHVKDVSLKDTPLKDTPLKDLPPNGAFQADQPDRTINGSSARNLWLAA